MEVMKPCPFCGGQPDMVYRESRLGRCYYRVECVKCGARANGVNVPMAKYEYCKKERWNNELFLLAIQQWNHRKVVPND